MKKKKLKIKKLDFKYEKYDLDLKGVSEKSDKSKIDNNNICSYCILQ